MVWFLYLRSFPSSYSRLTFPRTARQNREILQIDRACSRWGREKTSRPQSEGVSVRWSAAWEFGVIVVDVSCLYEMHFWWLCFDRCCISVNLKCAFVHWTSIAPCTSESFPFVTSNCGLLHLLKLPLNTLGLSNQFSGFLTLPQTSLTWMMVVVEKLDTCSTRFPLVIKEYRAV